MLLDIACSAVSSVIVKLKFDDGTRKVRLIAIDDLIDVVYNANGMRKHIIGRVSAISTVGTDPKNWYIIVDGSDDFASDRARFSPESILDVEIIRKAAQDSIVKTPLGENNAGYIRIMKGRLQYSNDGINWNPIKIDERDIIIDGEDEIRPQEGTVPARPHHHPSPVPTNDDEIEDAVY